jgi:hypothetical protein
MNRHACPTSSESAPDGTWTADIAKAGDFPSREALHKAQVKLDLGNCRRYYAFGDRTRTQYDFTTEVA